LIIIQQTEPYKALLKKFALRDSLRKGGKGKKPPYHCVTRDLIIADKKIGEGLLRALKEVNRERLEKLRAEYN
jgi:hypothetical protein